MIFKIFKWLLIGLAVSTTLITLAVITSSKLSFDRTFAHTSATQSLPVFDPKIGSKVVRIATGPMVFRARVAGFDGNQNKPAVILLHGFPVTSAMWTHLINPLAQAGYRVVAFDQRGYSPGARPQNIDDYLVKHLESDVIAVADALGLQKFHLVGHDWGAGIGWSVVLNHPARISSWTALSIAHPAAFSVAMEDDPEQRARSRYFDFLKIRWLPETLFSFGDFKLMKRIYRSMPPDEAAEYIGVFREPGALTATMNWYRGMEKGLSDIALDTNVNITTPTLFIWGNQDPVVGRASVDGMIQYMKGPYLNVELDASHWLLKEQRERVVTEVLAHIARHSRPK